MLSLSEKFLNENGRAGNPPALLVDILSHLLFNEQTTQSDWAANSGESNVDYTASPGDVVLAPAPVPNEEQTGHNDSAFVYSTTGLQGPFYHEAWQSFRQHTSTSNYADGQFDHLDHWGTWTYNMGDLYFRVTMTGEYYQPSGYIRTQSTDLGEVPPGTGEWVLGNIEPPATSIVY